MVERARCCMLFVAKIDRQLSGHMLPERKRAVEGSLGAIEKLLINLPAYVWLQVR